MGSIDGIEIGRVNIIGFHTEVNLFPFSPFAPLAILVTILRGIIFSTAIKTRVVEIMGEP
jgi:hypothetical protein